MFDWIPLAYDTPIFYVFIFVIVLNFCLKVLVKGYKFVPNTSVFNVFSVLILVFSLFFNRMRSKTNYSSKHSNKHRIR